MTSILVPFRILSTLLLFMTPWPRAKCWSAPVVKPTRGHGTALAPTSTRRSILALLSMLPVVVPLTSCQAEEADATLASRDPPQAGIGKPFAPKGALLPAARLKIVVDRMYELSLGLLKNTNDKEVQYQTLVEINQIWSTRPALFQKNEKMPPRNLTPASAQITTGVSSANKQQYQSIRKDLSIPDRVAAMLNQADVERQWGMLQFQESKRENENEVRAALNFYTAQLEFGDAYLLTATPEERKRMIRNDQLPTLTAVITSDLDLRDLYRNELLTALEDANAEVAYQLKQSPSEVDVTDVVELMGQAHTAIQNWFHLIAPYEVQEAFEMVQNEQLQSAG